MSADIEPRLKELFSSPAESEYRAVPPDEALEVALGIFEASGRLVERFGEERFAEGMVRLIDPGQSDDLTYLTNQKSNEVLRLRVIAAMKKVFEDCFLPRCSPQLLHLDEKAASPLNSVCYMWWERVPLFGEPGKPERKNIDAAAIDVMKDTLRLPSVAVQEAALHGLGHWVPEYPGVVEPIIDAYLATANIDRPELKAYAKKARTGMIN